MPSLDVFCGDSSLWIGDADIILSNPYAPIPPHLHGKPAIISLYERRGRREIAERWLGGAPLSLIDRWGSGLTNSVYVANLPVRSITLSDLVEDPPIYFPLDLPRRLIAGYAEFFPPGAVVFDGCCGRGTVGAACREKGLAFVGIDHDPAMIETARAYLGIS